MINFSFLKSFPCKLSLFSGFFLLLSTILGFATVFVSKPVEDEFEIKDKGMEVILVVGDSREDKKKPGLELEETQKKT